MPKERRDTCFKLKVKKWNLKKLLIQKVILTYLRLKSNFFKKYSTISYLNKLKKINYLVTHNKNLTFFSILENRLKTIIFRARIGTLKKHKQIISIKKGLILVNNRTIKNPLYLVPKNSIIRRLLKPLNKKQNINKSPLIIANKLALTSKVFLKISRRNLRVNKKLPLKQSYKKFNKIRYSQLTTEIINKPRKLDMLNPLSFIDVDLSKKSLILKKKLAAITTYKKKIPLKIRYKWVDRKIRPSWRVLPFRKQFNKTIWAENIIYKLWRPRNPILRPLKNLYKKQFFNLKKKLPKIVTKYLKKTATSKLQVTTSKNIDATKLKDFNKAKKVHKKHLIYFSKVNKRNFCIRNKKTILKDVKKFVHFFDLVKTQKISRFKPFWSIKKNKNVLKKYLNKQEKKTTSCFLVNKRKLFKKRQRTKYKLHIWTLTYFMKKKPNFNKIFYNKLLTKKALKSFVKQYW